MTLLEALLAHLDRRTLLLQHRLSTLEYVAGVEAAVESVSSADAHTLEILERVGIDKVLSVFCPWDAAEDNRRCGKK